MKTLIIDNYDSFTFNLYQWIGEVNGDEPLVIPNDRWSYEQVASMRFDNIVISPGPGRPENPRDFGVCAEVLSRCTAPLLGVCLGHQGLACMAGGRVVHAREPMHGRSSSIHHDRSPLFAGIPDGFLAVRYHSLVVADPLPPLLRKTAWTDDGQIMGLEHRQRPCWGVQFHPESICTEYGKRLLTNFRDLTRQWMKQKPATRAAANEPHVRARPAAREEPFELHSRKLAGLFDTEQAFVHLFRDDPVAFWLDSSRVEEGLSRFSAMGSGGGPLGRVVRYRGTGQLEIISADGATELRRQSIFDYLDQEIAGRRLAVPGLDFDLHCGFVGYLGYELKWECAAGGDGPRSPDQGRPDPSAMPDALFMLADRMLVFDHRDRATHLLCLVLRGDAPAAEAWFDEIEHRLRGLTPLAEPTPLVKSTSRSPRLARDRQTYLAQIRHCLQRIRDGESYELCLTNQLRGTSDADPLAVYRVLRKMNAAPYAAFLRFPEGSVLCSSPERFLRIDRDGWVESKPIKGTRRRGERPDEDARLREDLRTSAKDRAENLMIVDLVRNDLGRVCRTGSVSVPRLMEVETYATVHQLVSTIRGRLLPAATAIDCVRSAFPGGSMTGAPKRRTMEILEQLEGAPRGVYSGSIGYFALNGAADLNIVIRTIIMAGGTLRIGIGGAIIALSDPEEEFEETLLKGEVMVRALRHLERGAASRASRRRLENPWAHH